MARRRVVGNEPKGDVGEYSTISIENIICINSREIKDFTKKRGSSVRITVFNTILSPSMISVFQEI